MDYNSGIPGSADPGSMGAGAHYPDVDPSLTTALILDPTGPGYRLDSKFLPLHIGVEGVEWRGWGRYVWHPVM